MSGSAPAQTEPRGPRARGRELALAVMCHLESYGDDSPDARRRARTLVWDEPPQGEDTGEGHFAQLRADPQARPFADRLLDAWEQARAEIDAVIEETSRKWRLSRMAQVDRNLVRIAAVELSRVADTPRAVVLAEAVRLARRYGADHSPRFINGLVESLAQRLRPDEDGLRPEEDGPRPEEDGLPQQEDE